MDIYTNLFTSSKIKNPKPSPQLLHETKMIKVELPYTPIKSPINKTKADASTGKGR